jgi:hypothetical protein
VPKFVPTCKPEVLPGCAIEIPASHCLKATCGNTEQNLAKPINPLFSIPVQLLISGLEVRVLRGSPNLYRDLDRHTALALGCSSEQILLVSAD